MQETTPPLKRLAYFRSLRPRFEAYLIHERHAAPPTVKGYAEDLRRFLAHWALQSQDLGPANVDKVLVQDYLAQRMRQGLSLRSAARLACSLRHFFRWCVESGILRHDPLQGLRPLKVPRCLPKPLSEADVAALLRAADLRRSAGRRLRLAMELLYGSGLRVSEACGVSLGDLELARHLGPAVRVLGKGGQPRLAPLSQAFVALLPRLLGRYRRSPQSPLLVNRHDRRMTPDNLRHQLRTLARKAGLSGHVHPHRFRHSFATHLLDHGADIRVIQELMGHSQLGTTEIYTQVSSAKAAEVYLKAHPRDSFEAF